MHCSGYRYDRFDVDRIFHPRKMRSLWYGTVSQTLKTQPISDLHDYLDFHLNSEERIESIVSAIKQGFYRPSVPLQFASEKKLGICRPLQVLYPEDALVLEALGEHLRPIIKKAQTTSNSFLGNLTCNGGSFSGCSDSNDYPWWELWPKYRDRLRDIVERNRYFCRIDLANYYDSIDLVRLRNYLAGLGGISEAALDFLFYVLENLATGHQYQSLNRRSLPQISHNTMRLLAHAYLFDVDVLLEEKTDGSFARWVDDIDFGCESQDEARSIIAELNQLLLTKGLTINSAKANIFSSREAISQLNLNHIRYLSTLQRCLSHSRTSKGTACRLQELFRKRSSIVLSDESASRTVHLLRELLKGAVAADDASLRGIAGSLIVNEPALRGQILSYYQKLGWCPKCEASLTNFIENAVDDEGFFRAVMVLINWPTPMDVRFIARMRQLARRIVTERPVRFLGSLWLLAKFGSRRDIERLVNEYASVWGGSDWIARQVAALWPRIDNAAAKNLVERKVNRNGLRQAGFVLDTYKRLSENPESVSADVITRSVLKNASANYPLPKLLTALVVLQGSIKYSQRLELSRRLLENVKDPLYRLYIRKALAVREIGSGAPGNYSGYVDSVSGNDAIKESRQMSYDGKSKQPA